MVTQFFSVFKPPNNKSPKKYLHTLTYFSLRPSHLETSPEDTSTKSSVTSFLSLNFRQYDSNHCKQDLVITTSKNFHYLVELQVMKSTNFALDQPAITKSTHLQSTHTLYPTSKAHYLFINTLRKIQQENFPSQGLRKEILNSHRLLIPLINSRNKKDEASDSPNVPHP